MAQPVHMRADLAVLSGRMRRLVVDVLEAQELQGQQAQRDRRQQAALDELVAQTLQHGRFPGRTGVSVFGRREKFPPGADRIPQMKIYPEKLSAGLRQGLAPCYLIAGDEPLLVEEAADAVRAAAREAGYGEREVHFVEPGFDWQALVAASASLSLFAARRIVEIRLPTGKPGDTGGKVLQELAVNPPDDTLFLLISARVDGRAAWVKALEKAGVHVPCWPLDAGRLPDWIGNRLRARGLAAEPAAVQLLAGRVEGNLLAAAQEIDKLALLADTDKPLGAEAVAAAVSDSARFDVFGCVDAALAGNGARAVRMARGLRAEGTAALLLLGMLVREYRQLAGMASALEEGLGEQAVFGRYRVWDKRKPVYSRALKRLKTGAWRRLLLKAARVDRVAKGLGSGDAWDELIKLLAETAGSLRLPMTA